ncbi:hypothetical protein AMS68_003032 [Peltaster fructicola]|uniref:Pescadillo homolog n=1 Tax=Peltaster fructicola TaxID=286661 RepID=A0A6H0XSA5_9PEZI|nr:hypothetical protein AMS68_003032 [Peltaster fructicola]
MGKIQKKGKAGNAKNYITRSQAVRRLQVSLPDFRRLCIFKGIYPREPRSRKRVSKSATPSTTFYYAKDIQYLLHEPLLAKFREQKALAKKIAKALGRNEVGEAARFEKNLTPKIRLDHIIKERYPTFVDAIRDLDDALSTLYLFANLPSIECVPPKLVARCQRLTMEFEHYLIRTHGLRKSFLSIKGIYYQATIQGQDILWLVPYRFVQRQGPDVDFRIMATFVEFYATLLGFVNFRLYTSIGLVYPPRLDAQKQAQGAELSAFDLESQNRQENTAEVMQIDSEANTRAQAEADLLQGGEVQQNESEQRANVEKSLDVFTSIDPSADILLQPSLSSDSQVVSQLFASATIFLSRETPRHALDFIVRAFGCKRVAWDSSLGEGSYCDEADTRITHQIIDRPDLPLPSPPLTDADEDPDEIAAQAAARKRNERVPGRIYVQPQWVWDSLNLGKLQRPDLYGPGATLPPHLSPFVKAKKGEYDPTLPLAEQETELEREAARIEAEAEDESEDEAASEEEEDEGDDIQDEQQDDGGMDVELGAESDEDEEDEPDGGFDGFSGDEEDLDDTSRAARAHQAELEAEALGNSVTDRQPQTKSSKLAAVARKRNNINQTETDEIDRRKMMMSRRKRKVYDKMLYSNARKDEEAEKLRGKRRKIEKARS